jgi:hypothetical protein
MLGEQQAMTTKVDYTQDEWDTLAAMPAVVGLAVVLAQESQPRGRKDELRALDGAIVTAAGEYPANELVQAVLTDARAAAAADDVTKYGRQRQTARALEIAIDWCEKVNAILASKATFLEADGYKRFLLTAGLEVALASADAEYLGIGGNKLSIGERKTLLKLVDVLEVDYDY